MEKIEHTTVATNGINMHVASIGEGPVILFIHGFPELWYSWRHQLLSLSSLGYRCIAPDLRGYGDTDAPASVSEYTGLHLVGDLIGLLDTLGIEQVFLVGHDWGAIIAWHFCLFRPDRIKALVNTSVPFMPRHPLVNPVEGFRALFGDDFYMCRFQEPDEAEKDFAQVDTGSLITRFFTSRNPKPPCIPKHVGFRSLPEPPSLPSWLSKEDVNYYANKFNQKGFTGGLNYYRALNLTWELMAPWTGLQIKVPVLFIIGDLDITYHIPGFKEYIHNGGFKKDVPLLQEVVVLEGVAHFLTQEKPDESDGGVSHMDSDSYENGAVNIGVDMFVWNTSN
ncbi:unnamed protein product [Dovyalis caffra]|uniref:soluble epoxide hydrolase n=1 Tax=Dovyalis caffra TaxID=77055 RepID=A0AAV1SDU5_9ROSI|nr:unnamed protein product [Dovyalis caffra]